MWFATRRRGGGSTRRDWKGLISMRHLGESKTGSSFCFDSTWSDALISGCTQAITTPSSLHKPFTSSTRPRARRPQSRP